MGSSRRRRYTRSGRFGRKTGRFSVRSKIRQQELSQKNSEQSTVPASLGNSSYNINKLDSAGLRIRISRNINDNSTVVSTSRSLYHVNKTTYNGEKITLSLKKKNISAIQGYRIIDLNLLNEHINNVSVHISKCNSALSRISKNLHPYRLLQESKRFGLASVLLAQCLGCLESFYFHTSDKSEFGKHVFHDVNARAVWGQMVTGGGCSSLNEQAATLDMPGMTQKTFTRIESGIGFIWEECTQQEMLEAGCEERRLAMQMNDFDEGIPAITVVCDGGWSKRSHKHSYNAPGGVAVIIGAETKRILYMGVLNKNCSTCTKYENKNENPPEHQCFRNWTGSSQGMESQIIIEGFLAAEKMHGLRYMRMIGDGDSSVYARVQEEVPLWGYKVKKIECANHITKCLRTKLEQLVIDNPQYKGKNMLTKVKRIKLVACVRSMIAFRSSSEQSIEKQLNITLLKKDIMNSARHIFGIHTDCSDFCKVKNISCVATLSTAHSDPPELAKSTNMDEQEEVLNDLVDYWKEGTSQKELADARLSSDDIFDLDPSLHRDIQIYLQRIADKAENLLTGSTTNLAECWMNMRCKFDGGKVINRCNKGSWHFRCYGALLRKNLGVNWAPLAWEQATGTCAGRAFQDEYHRKKRHLDWTRLAQKKKDYKTKRWKRRLSALRANTTKRARLEYGPDIIEETTDITEEQLTDKINFFYEKEINVSVKIMEHIEVNTRDQSASGYWIDERRKRITASNFASVIKRRPSIPVKKLVEKMLYSTFTGNRLTRRGLRLEKFALQEYTNYCHEKGDTVTVTKMGLHISRDHPFLGASIDGHVVSEKYGEGILEIKHVLMNKIMMFQEAALKTKGFCLEMVAGKLKLKRRHDFHIQIQGQLNVLNLPWADLIVRRVDPHQIHVERIYRDTSIWTQNMLPKLKSFYWKAILPELTAPRNGKKPGIREPGVWFTEDKPAPIAKPVKALKRGKTSRESVGRKETKTESTSDSGSSPVLESELENSDGNRSTIKFLNKSIFHEWEDEFGRIECYMGKVVDVFYANDGDEEAAYEVMYEGDDGKYEIDYVELMDDYLTGSLQIID